MDRKFQDLEALESTLSPLTRPPRPQWMSDTTTRMIDECTALSHNPLHKINVERKITKSVWRSLLVDSRQPAEKAADDIGACLEPLTVNPDLRGAYAVLKSWYCHASARALNPSEADMAKFIGDYYALYRRKETTPSGIPLPNHIKPFRVNDNVPSEEDVYSLVRHLRLRKAGRHNHLHMNRF